MAPPGSAYYAGATAAPKRNPYLPGDDAVNEPDNLDGVPSTQPSSLARSRGGGATAVSPGAGTNPTGAYSPDPSSFGSSGAGNPAPNIIRDVYSPELQDVASRLQSAYAAPRPGMARQVLGAVLSRRNPAIGGLVSGETQRARTIEPLQQQYGLVAGQIAATRAADTADISNQLHVAQTGQAIDRGKLALAQANAKETPTDKVIDKGFDADGNAMLTMQRPDNTTYQQKVPGMMNPATQKPTAPVRGELTDVDIGGVNHKVLVDPTTGKTIQDLGQSKLPKGPDQDIADLNKQLKQAQLEKLKEPTPDEQRRDDLARNAEENLDQLQDVLTRRPDLFGPVGGRLTALRGAIGTNDPDVSKLKALKEFYGMASVGAHAMKNAQHVSTAADAVMNGFNNGPDAMKGAISTARSSFQTFHQDAQRRRGAINAATGAGQSAPATNSKDPLGIL